MRTATNRPPFIVRPKGRGFRAKAGEHLRPNGPGFTALEARLHGLATLWSVAIGTSPRHIARAKDLFRALAQADLQKEWIAQATIDFADDEELRTLAAKAGCRGVFMGFERPTTEGLRELGKKFDLLRSRDFRASVRRIQRHGILVVGSFIIGLNVDEPGIRRRIAEAAG